MADNFAQWLAEQPRRLNPEIVSGTTRSGDAAAKSINKYNVGKYQYPEDVNKSPDLLHSMAFFINVRGNSKIKKNGTDILFELGDDRMLNRTGMGLAIAGGTAVAAAVPLMKSLSWSAISKKVATGASVKQAIGSEAIKGAGASAAGVATGIALESVALGLGSTSMHRLKDAVLLAIQEPPKVSYSMEYEDFDAGTLMGGLSGDIHLGDMAAAGILKFAELPSVVGAPNFSKGIQSMSGTAINPFKTTLFKSVNLREFTFNYKFMAKSKNEADNIRNIIRIFKVHMHPEFSASKIFLTHPSEFNIVYYYKGVENPNFNKISTCVLLKMDVDSGADQLATFQDGMSVEINMTLHFRETEMLTREKIQEGY